MDRRNLKWITWGFIGITVLIVALMLGGTLRRTTHITLPETDAVTGQSSGTPSVSGDALTVVEISPETVQAAIATLTRPQNYRRTVTVEQFWDGGSGTYELTVAANKNWTRTDRTMPDGRIRHTITGQDTVYIWYNHERDIYTAFAGTITADHEQTIPTYEDILELEPDQILIADYRPVSGVNCIYVETAEDESGYVVRYWVSVDTGLLAVAEKLLNETPVYRMAALNVDTNVVTQEEFTLPDGTSLIEE